MSGWTPPETVPTDEWVRLRLGWDGGHAIESAHLWIKDGDDWRNGEDYLLSEYSAATIIGWRPR